MSPLPIEVEFVWDERHYGRAIRAYMGGRWQRVHTLLFLLFAAYLIYAAARMLAYSSAAWPLATIYLLFAGVLLVLRGPGRGIWIRRRFRSRPDRNRTVRYVFDENGVRGETDGLAKTEIDWSMPLRAQVTRNTLLIYLTPKQYMYVPLDQNRDELLALVRNKLPSDRTRCVGDEA